MCKSPEYRIPKDERIEKNSIEFSQEKIDIKAREYHNKLEKIHEKEYASQVEDYLEMNKEVLGIKNIFFTKKALLEHLKEMKTLDVSYSLFDEETRGVEAIINAYKENKEQAVLTNNKEQKRIIAERLEEELLLLKGKGLSNLEVIQKILQKEEEGELSIPKKKVEQYQKLLALTKDVNLLDDRDYIIELMQQDEELLLEESSFENFVYRLYENPQISEKTKVALEKKYGIYPIHMGGDLKAALNHRETILVAYEQKLHKYGLEQQQLEEKKNAKEEELENLKNQLALELGGFAQQKLYQQIAKLEGELKQLRKDQVELKAEKAWVKTKSPTSKVYLRGYEATLEKNIIKIKDPLSKKSIAVPLRLDNKSLGEVTNTLFLYKLLEEAQIAKIIFPDEKFKEGHLPSTSMIRYSNEILAALNLGHSGTILKKEELYNLVAQIMRLKNSTKIISNQSKPKSNQQTFQEKGLLQGGVFLRYKFIELLEHMAVHTGD
jgi:hypothetical protein